MKKMGKWFLSLMVAVSLTMPVLADVNVQESEMSNVDAVETQMEGAEIELQTETESTIETESETESETETETETETESESEEETEDPVDVKLDDFLNTAVVLKQSACVDFEETEIQWEPFSLMAVKSYRIYRKTAGSKWEHLEDVAGTSTSYIDTTVENGQKYIYTVRAIQTFEGIDYLSQYDKAGIECAAMPEAPVIYSELMGYNQAELSWTEVDHADFYRVYMKDDNTGKWKRIAQVNGRSYDVKSLVCGKKYIYTVRAFKKSNNKEVSSDYNRKGIEIQTIPETPVLNKLSMNNDGSVKVSWKTAAGAAQYRVYRKSSAKDAFKLLGSTKSASYADKTAKAGGTYIYTVKAVAVAGNDRSSSDFDHKGVSMTVAPGMPKLKKLSGSSYKALTVGWTAVDGADGYCVYRKTVGGSWSRIAQIKDGKKESYTDKTAASSKVYIYTVRAYCESNGQICLSNYDHTGVYWIDTPKMKAISVYSEKSEIKHGTIRYNIMTGWGEVKGADGYYIYRKVGNGKWQKLREGNIVNTIDPGDGTGLITDADVTEGTTYAYTVRAYCNVNGKIYLSGYDSKGSSATVR